MAVLWVILGEGLCPAPANGNGEENLLRGENNLSTRHSLLSAAAAAAAKLLQSCPTLCNPIDGSLTGSPVPGILQARTLEWVAISFSNA